MPFSNIRPVGSVYFRDIDRVKKEAEYGIFLGEDDAAGKGYGTEAAKLAGGPLLFHPMQCLFNLLYHFRQRHFRAVTRNTRNFGQHAALMAGFHQVNGDVVVCLDDDGQTPADEVDKLLEEIDNGSDVVYAKYEHKKHSAFRNFGSWVNEEMARVMLGKPRELYVSSYFAAKRFVVEEMKKYTNAYPYVIGLVLRTTKRISNVSVCHREREIGSSGYTFGKLLELWFNGFTAFSVKPLRLATAVGCMCSVCGFLYGIYTVIKKLVNPNVPMGFSSLMAAIVFMGGMMMMMLGLVGEYIGRMYISMNNSPQFVIRETINEEEW